MLRKSAILILFLFSTLFTQVNQDARILGLNGSYTTLASGFRAVGINPANLVVYPNKSWNIFDFSFGLNNNYFSIENYNALSGSHLDDSTHENYYPKENILDEFGGRGIRIWQSLNFPLPALNMSTHRMALTSRFTSNFDMGLSDGMIQFLFSGNPFGEDRYLDIEEVLLSNLEMGFSYGYSLHNYSVGITVKYFLGLFYMGMEPLSSPTLTTGSHGFYGHPKYIIRQGMGGNGLGLDVGITSNEFDDGYRLGMSIINLFGTIKWTQNHFIRGMLEPSISQMDYYLNPNELIYVNMVVDSVNYLNSYSANELDTPLVYYETYKVIPLETIDASDNEALVVELSDGTYVYPSGGDYAKYGILPVGSADTTYAVSDSAYSSGGHNPFTTRQPMYLRMGISRTWVGQGVVAIDLVTGFFNQSSSSTTWRLSLGTEITRFKNQFLRMGYFCADSKDFTSHIPVFNRSVTLRDTWAKITKQNK